MMGPTEEGRWRMLYCILVGGLIVFAAVAVSGAKQDGKKQQVSRKSLVFDIKTPKVFYCPQEKQSDYSKTIVKARPLEKLCEFGGDLKPKGRPSDCYNDVDETQFACDEKKRFLLRLEPLEQEEAIQEQQQQHQQAAVAQATAASTPDSPLDLLLDAN